MTGPARYFYETLKATQDRAELALTWKVYREVKQHFKELDWKPVEQAFKQRATDLGLDWKK
jgi:glutamate formiminotransferase